MSLVTTLVDDKSPLIQYDSGFNPGIAADDTSADRYFRGTSQRSNVVGSVAKFSFDGTAVWIYGAKRSNYGNYTVTLDNTSSVYNGEANPDEFQQVLFTQGGLTQGPHTVSLTNTGPTPGSWFDIDMVAWQTEFTGTQLETEAIDDTDSRFQYPNAAWNTNPTSAILNLFNNGTGHSTSVADATVTLTFTAESVSIFGTVGPNNGPYSVSLDSGQATQYNATTYMTLYEVVLYHTDNLGPGQHQLTLTNLPEANGQTLNIDYALLTSSSSSSSSSSGSSPTSGSSSSTSVYVNSTGLSSVAIAGIAVAAVVAHSALTAAFLFYRGRKSTQKASRDSSRINKSQKRLENANTGASTPEETSSYATPDKPRRPRRPHTSYQQQDHYFEVSPPSLRVPSSPVFEIPRTQPPVNEPRRPPTKIPSTQDYYFEVSPPSRTRHVPSPPVFEIITSPIQPSVDEVELFVSALRSPPESSSTQDYRFDVSRSSRTRPIPRSITSPTQSSVDEPRSSRRPPTEPPGTQDYHFEVSPPSRTRRVPRLRVPRPHVFEIMTSPTQSSIDEPRSSRHPPPEAPPYQNIIQQPVPNESENANSGASTPVEASGYTTCDAY